MSFWRNIFGEPAERKADRQDSRWQLLIFALILAGLVGAAVISGLWFDGRNTGLYALLAIPAGLLFLQALLEAVFAHTTGLRPVMLILAVVIVLFVIVQAIRWLIGAIP